MQKTTAKPNMLSNINTAYDSHSHRNCVIYDLTAKTEPVWVSAVDDDNLYNQSVNQSFITLRPHDEGLTCSIPHRQKQAPPLKWFSSGHG